MRTVSREGLYNQIWLKPMTKVAADYGVTGTALKKTCDRHCIPTPPLGYWAKLKHGKPVTKPGLPNIEDPHLQQVRIAGDSARRLPEAVRSARSEARKSLRQDASPVVVTSSTTAVQPEARVLAATRRAILKARHDAQGFATANGPSIVAVEASTRLGGTSNGDSEHPALSRADARARALGKQRRTPRWSSMASPSRLGSRSDRKRRCMCRRPRSSGSNSSELGGAAPTRPGRNTTIPPPAASQS